MKAETLVECELKSYLDVLRQRSGVDNIPRIESSKE